MTSVSAGSTATRAADRVSATTAPTTATVPAGVSRAVTTPAAATAKGQNQSINQAIYLSTLLVHNIRGNVQVLLLLLPFNGFFSRTTPGEPVPEK